MCNKTKFYTSRRFYLNNPTNKLNGMPLLGQHHRTTYKLYTLDTQTFLVYLEIVNIKPFKIKRSKACH